MVLFIYQLQDSTMNFVTNHAERSSLYGFEHDGALITFGHAGFVQVLSSNTECMGGFFKIDHPQVAILAQMDKLSTTFHNWVEDKDPDYNKVIARGTELDKKLNALASSIPADLLQLLQDLVKVKRTPEEAGASFSLLAASFKV
jgi:hypothetical protein